jgi:hypothetical protein
MNRILHIPYFCVNFTFVFQKDNKKKNSVVFLINYTPHHETYRGAEV